jgi:hypothetical protein
VKTVSLLWENNKHCKEIFGHKRNLCFSENDHGVHISKEMAEIAERIKSIDGKAPTLFSTILVAASGTA